MLDDQYLRCHHQLYFAVKHFSGIKRDDDVYEKKVNFRTKAVLYFKNGAPVTKENYESELGAKRAAWKATNN